MTTVSPEQFAATFGSAFQERAFRLELLDSYVAANEAEPLRRFLAGEPRDDAWREPWRRLVSSARVAGRRMSRVHVVTEPLGDYTRFELTWAYPVNVEAGEDVRILPRSIADRMDLPDRDYWLLDAKRVAIMDYDDQGNWLGVRLTEDPYRVARHLRGRDLAVEHGIPLLSYLEETEGAARVW